ncbi:hypothetical protein AGMMS49953_01250 [Endomicrobiia bacterium]|uniref:hypothetical protein n=1 Tax=Endomicrobium trichonymphae TaxID=1408204 RepID=UPI0003264D1E|nr:hypothetical protein [Candidatus Endomicrobium trichonymphae]GHT22437.1 hypothetical protein AGMMS49953_01250 [Endomicrobiia bacterium]
MLYSKTLEIKEKDIKILHGYITGNGKPKPTNYRTEQNVIKNFGSGKIVYLFSEAKDVPKLMSAFFA